MAHRTPHTLGSRPPRDRNLRVLALVLALAGVLAAGLLAGCGVSRGSAGSSAGAVNQQAAAVLRQLSSCVRAHGVPSFPDPQIGSDGAPRLPDSAPRVPVAAQRACEAIVNRIPAQYSSTQAVAASDFQKLLQFARCVRAHGIRDWPDPNSLGEFPIDQRIEAAGKPPIEQAAHVCARLNPDPSGGIHVVRAH